MPLPSISFLTTLGRLHRLRGRADRALLILTLSAFVWAQNGNSASVQGTVRDGQGRAVAQAQVQLQAKDSRQLLTAASDEHGSYTFRQLRDGVYVLRVVSASGTAEIPSIALGANETKTVDVRLGSAASSGQSAPQFYDEPQFTVSGVTDTTNLGGHGSDTVVRTQDSLAKETATLAHPETVGGADRAATEKSLREALAHEPASAEANHRLGVLLLASGRADEAVAYLRRAAEIQPGDAEVHHALGDAEEKRGDSLEAVRQYQRAAELDASEPYLFDWGAELLLHHAPEPAIEVFTKGNSRYPKSARMLIGLGAAAFARGANEQAVQRMCEASDLNPVDPTPYLFLGKML
ncbi:MAG: carboxypeptidase regulatory-like domain-containing protein, partial [Acidobacteriota bacterium]